MLHDRSGLNPLHDNALQRNTGRSEKRPAASFIVLYTSDSVYVHQHFTSARRLPEHPDQSGLPAAGGSLVDCGDSACLARDAVYRESFSAQAATREPARDLASSVAFLAVSRSLGKT